MTENIVYVTKYDVPSRRAVVSIIEWAEREHDVHLQFTDALDFVGLVTNPLIYEDFAEYIVDCINERGEFGEWYTLTADFNIKREVAE